MTDYRCYFLEPAGAAFGVPSRIDAAENVTAESDDQARRAAEALYRRRRNQIHGFELWQGARLVYRRPADAAPGPAARGLVDRTG